MALPQKTIDDFCRLCAIESQSGTIIYSSEGESLCLEDKIINCLRIEVSPDDMLPKKVCQLCTELLEDYHRFCKRAMQVQQTLGLLLGLHTSHLPADDAELCLMETNVKMESNLIKNELDELIINQGASLQSDGNKFDLSLEVRVCDEYANDDERKKLILEDLSHRELIEDRHDFSNAAIHLGDVGYIDNTRQLHRRKMTQPKKAASAVVITSNKTENPQCLNEIEDIDCIITDANGNEADFKSEEFNEHELFDNMVEGENNSQIAADNEEMEEDTDIEKEWRKHWGIMCDQCANVFSTKTLFDKHYRLCYGKLPVYTCSYCKKSMDKYSSYRSHCFMHIYDGQFKCKFCDKKFFMKGMLQVHEMTHNGPDKPYTCEECGLGFPSQQKLGLHQRNHRAPAQKEFRCTECGKILQTKGGLSAHLTVHKLGRRFMCHLCGKTFTQKINMQQHVKHHKGEKPYSCENCGKSFAEKSHLNRHKSFHTLDRPYQCPVCKKMYKTERCLKVHSHVHLNTRPYVCSYCGKGFLSSAKLKQHCNCHTGERPFACKYCEKTFTNYPNCLKHTRRRHKVDHKTGLSLKEETQTQATFQLNVNSLTEDGGLVPGSIEMRNIEVKEDEGRDSVQSHHSIGGHPIPGLDPAAFVPQFQDHQNDLSEFQVHSVPVNSENVYVEYVAPCFRFNFKEVAQTEI